MMHFLVKKKKNGRRGLSYPFGFDWTVKSDRGLGEGLNDMSKNKSHFRVRES